MPVAFRRRLTKPVRGISKARPASRTFVPLLSDRQDNQRESRRPRRGAANAVVGGTRATSRDRTDRGCCNGMVKIVAQVKREHPTARARSPMPNQ